MQKVIKQINCLISEIKADKHDEESVCLRLEEIRDEMYGEQMRKSFEVSENITPEEIKEIRKKAGKTQEEFAEMLNVSKDTVASWELGRRKPLGTAVKMLRMFEKK